MSQETIVYIIGAILATLASIHIVRFLTGKHDPCGACGHCNDSDTIEKTTCSDTK